MQATAGSNDTSAEGGVVDKGGSFDGAVKSIDASGASSLKIGQHQSDIGNESHTVPQPNTGRNDALAAGDIVRSQIR